MNERRIRRFILGFEKKNKIYPPSYLGNAEHQNSLDGIEGETRSFHARIRIGIPDSYRIGGSVIYIVTDKKTGDRYKVQHFFPNKNFDASYGWYITKESIKE